MRARRCFPPANVSGREDILSRGGEAPTDGASQLLKAAKTRAAGSRADKVAMESLGRIRLNRTPVMRYAGISGPKAGATDRNPAYFRKAARVFGDELARALALEGDFICDAFRISFTTFAPLARGSKPRTVLSGDTKHALGIARTPRR